MVRKNEKKKKKQYVNRLINNSPDRQTQFAQWLLIYGNMLIFTEDCFEWSELSIFLSVGSVPSLASGLLFGGLASFGAYQVSQNPQNIYVSLGWYFYSFTQS